MYCSCNYGWYTVNLKADESAIKLQLVESKQENLSKRYLNTFEQCVYARK